MTPSDSHPDPITAWLLRRPDLTPEQVIAAIQLECAIRETVTEVWR